MKKLTILTVLAIAFITAGLGCKQSGEARKFKPVLLEYWGVFEEPSAIASLTTPYTKRHPKIQLKYRKFREEEYREKILEEWARGRGPDLFMVPNNKIREYLRFITPMPATMKAPIEYQKGTIKKETIVEIQTYTGYVPKQIRDIFLDTVADDVIIDNQIYALPYSVDTLSVYYNREMLKNNNIPVPARTWEDLIAQATLISKVDTEDNLIQSTVALGTTNNLPAVVDIVSTLMMQIGIVVGDEKGPQFQLDTQSLDAIQFYLTFAQKGLQNYSWSPEIPDALDAFTAGKLAYFIGYPYHAELIKQANPTLDWDVIPMFKPANSENVPTYASYWVTVVRKPPEGSTADARQRAELAWQYLLEASQARNVKPFLDNQTPRRTTALRELVAEQMADPELAPFAQNLLNARSWYKGYNFELAEQYFLEMIDTIQDAYENNLDPAQFLTAGASRISQTYLPPRD